MLPTINTLRLRALSAFSIFPLLFFGLFWSSLTYKAALTDEPLMVDLTERFVEVTTGFTGKSITLFGAVDQKSDIILVVEGPSATISLREKGKVAGIWTNIHQEKISYVPSFYHIASNKTLSSFEDKKFYKDWELGFHNLTFNFLEPLSASEQSRYHDALIQQMEHKKLYTAAPNSITFPRERLFKTTISFPDNIPTGTSHSTGTYSVTVFMVKDGKLSDVDTSTILISKAGFSDRIYSFSQKNGALYGIFAILSALLCGWLGNIIFKRR